MSSVTELWKQATAFARGLGIDMDKLDWSTLLLIFGRPDDFDPDARTRRASGRESRRRTGNSANGDHDDEEDDRGEEDGGEEESFFDEDELRGVLAMQSSVELPSIFDEDDDLDSVYGASAASSKSTKRASLVSSIRKRVSFRGARQRRASRDPRAGVPLARSSSPDDDDNDDDDGGDGDFEARSTASCPLGDLDEAYLVDALESLTPKQAAALELMRANFVDADCEETRRGLGLFRLNDATYLRFLQSKDFNVRRAVDALTKHLEWRDEIMPSTLRSSDVREALATGLVRRGHVSKDGHPVILIDAGNLDTKLFAGEGIGLFVKLCAYTFEQSAREMPRGLYENIMVLDAGRFSYRDQAGKAAMEVLKMLISVLQNQYPALIKKIYLVNSPTMATIAWNAVRFVLSRDLKSRIIFIRKIEQMREIIDEDMLMHTQGGNKTVPFPIHGVDIPAPGEEAEWSAEAST